MLRTVKAVGSLRLSKGIHLRSQHCTSAKNSFRKTTVTTKQILQCPTSSRDVLGSTSYGKSAVLRTHPGALPAGRRFYQHLTPPITRTG